MLGCVLRTPSSIEEAWIGGQKSIQESNILRTKPTISTSQIPVLSSHRFCRSQKAPHLGHLSPSDDAWLLEIQGLGLNRIEQDWRKLNRIEQEFGNFLDQMLKHNLCHLLQLCQLLDSAATLESPFVKRDSHATWHTKVLHSLGVGSGNSNPKIHIE